MRHHPTWIVLGVIGSCWLFAPHATASTTFPEAVRKQLGLQQIADPPLGCQLCHQDDNGGYATATKPFGRSLLKAGAAGGSVPSLLTALKALEANGTDSDHDGVGDIDELKAGTDPDVAATIDGSPAPTFEEVPLPQTGCSLSGATLGGTTTLSGSWAALLVAASLLLRRRDRRS